ncbi:MAG: hypothetical protein HY700_17370 [Gemmatimonadetes bacterium]|nr:hypothetical protein [Gemmatimonadota bacterium]
MAAALLCVRAAAGLAQFSVGTAYGGYAPLGGSLIKELGGLNGSPVSYPVFEKWHTGAPVLSARVSRRMTPRFSLEAKFAHSPGRVDTRDSTNTVVERSGYIMMISVRAPVRITSPLSSTFFHVAPGLAMIRRGGRAWRGYAGTTRPAVLLAIGVGGLLGRRSRFSSRIELEDYASFVQFNYDRWQPTTRRLHHDLMLTVGVDYSFRRPPRRVR